MNIYKRQSEVEIMDKSHEVNAFCNKENVLNVIRENVSADERAELDDACNEAMLNGCKL